MISNVDEWLRSFPIEISPQRDLIRRLLREARQDGRFRLFVVGCSIGRGAADSLSDVDAHLGVEAGAWPAVLATTDALVRKVGNLVDLYQQTLTSPEGREYQHTFAQYADRVQLDLTVAPVHAKRQPRPDWVVLYDPDARVQGAPKRDAATPELVRQWMYSGLVRLSACAKYLTRGSLWEASFQLDAARADLWRLWAVAHGVADPQYGLTAVLDSPGTRVPSSLKRTVAGLDRAELARAANACVDLLIGTWRAATVATGESLPVPPLAASVRKQLRSTRPRPPARSPRASGRESPRRGRSRRAR